MSFPGEPPNPWSREAQSGQWPASGPYQAPPPYQPQPFGPPPPPPRSPRGRVLWVAFGVVMALVVGAAIWGAVAETRSHGSAAAPPAGSGSGQSAVDQGQTTVVTASDKKSQLTVPASWKDVPPSFREELAVIQRGDLRREQYVIVATLDRDDFEDFDAFSAAMLEGAQGALDEAEVGQPRNLTLGGLPAVQYEITGKAQGIKVVFWYTMVSGKNGFYQVVAWTLPSKRAEAEPTITQVISSFRELGGA
jgi:hypothetical protein